VTTAVPPVLVVLAADPGLQDHAADPVLTVGNREPVQRLLGHHLERPLGAGLDAELERQPDGADLLGGFGHDGLSYLGCLGDPLEREQAGRAGVSHRPHPALVPLAQRNRVEVVDTVPAAALDEHDARVDQDAKMLHDREPAQLGQLAG